MAGLLDRLLSDSRTLPPANPANLRIFDAAAPVNSQIRKIRKGCPSEKTYADPGKFADSQNSQGGTGATRLYLLALCADALQPASLVHGLAEADVAACTGLPDDTLRAYLRTLERGQRMRAGMVPGEYGAIAHCDGCGPIHWHRPERLLACPWCHLRREGRKIPRPAVRCGDCLHYLPDLLNPAAGAGVCKAGHGARWPMMAHPCEAMKQTVSLLISNSVEPEPCAGG